MKRITSKDVLCPICGAESGQPCRGSVAAHRGHRKVQSHRDRVKAAKAANERR